MRLILIRHCKTLFNESGHIMGWSDSPKVENWLDDILSIEDELKQRDQIPDHIYTSALGRARHTGDYLARQFGCPACHHRHLNEVNYGELAGKPKKWVAEHYPRHKKDPDFVYPGGESFSAMRNRVVGFILELASNHKGESLLCVAHAGVIRALVSHFLHLDFATQLKRRVPHRYIGALSFEGTLCQSYEEWGELSGFIADGVIILPWVASSPCAQPA